MANELIINASLPETRIALMEDGEIQELLIERASGKGIVGNIYKGRVTRVLPGMQAAFVDIGLEKAAFLYVDDVYVHSEVWEEVEGSPKANVSAEVQASEAEGPKRKSGPTVSPQGVQEGVQVGSPLAENGSPEVQVSQATSSQESEGSQHDGQPEGAIETSTEAQIAHSESPEADPAAGDPDADEFEDSHDLDGDAGEDFDADEEDDDDSGPVKMDRDRRDSSSDGDSSEPSAHQEPSQSEEGYFAKSSTDDSAGHGSQSDQPEGTVAPTGGEQEASGGNTEAQPKPRHTGDEKDQAGGSRKKHRRGRRGGRFRRKGTSGDAPAVQANVKYPENFPDNVPENYPDHFHNQVADSGKSDSDRSSVSDQNPPSADESAAGVNRPEVSQSEPSTERRVIAPNSAERGEFKAEFRSQRSRDRRIRPKSSSRPIRNQVNIQDLLKEGQEVLVQVAKDPIATKGARLTCHISLPGRHLVCMPTIDHVGVSRRIEREDERRRLREYVERNRPRNLGFIVRTASGKQQSEKRIKQDIEYLTHLWNEIREKATSVTAPALVYEDLNAVLRAIRDWVNEDIDKVIVDSRYHYNEIQRFVSHFMPPLKQKVELYHGDIPIFDAYSISTELSRALERKVWLKSGGYIVIDQAEALVAIDVNTGRYVGKKNLEDTILKTNLEAVKEIAYQLRLRNCGGIIILDLIDMEKDENKQRVYRALEDALSRDRARPTILKISELGLVEMTRKRTRDTIVRTLCESCTHCEGKGFIKAKQTVAYEVLRELEREGIERDVSKILVQAHSDVIDILAIDEKETLDQLEKKFRKQVYLQAVTDFHPEQFEVSAEKRERTGREAHRDHDRSHSHSDRQDSDRHSRHRDKHHRHDRSEHRSEHRNENRSEHRSEPAKLPTPLPVPLATPVIRPVENAAHSASEAGTPAPGAVKSQAGDVDEDSQVRFQLGTSNSTGGSPSPVSGNMAGNSGPAQSAGGPGASSQGDDSGFDEEDRLAFLRAQAAQDAALARLGSNPRPGQENNNRDRGGGGGGGRRNARGGRRGSGGKFRPRNDRGRDRNGKPGYGGHQRWSESSGKDAGPSPGNSQPSTSGSGSTGGSGGGGGDTGSRSGSSGGTSGGGDHSQSF